MTANLLKMERETGIEPATSSLGSWHSTAELLPHPLITAPLCYQISTWGTHHSEPVQGRILHEHRTALIQKAVDQKIRFVLSMILLFLTSTCPECLTSAAPYELPFGTW